MFVYYMQWLREDFVQSDTISVGQRPIRMTCFPVEKTNWFDESASQYPSISALYGAAAVVVGAASGDLARGGAGAGVGVCVGAAATLVLSRCHPSLKRGLSFKVFMSLALRACSRDNATSLAPRGFISASYSETASWSVFSSYTAALMASTMSEASLTALLRPWPRSVMKRISQLYTLISNYIDLELEEYTHEVASNVQHLLQG